MSEPVRIALRLLGLVLFLVGLAGVVALFKPGPSEVADWMGGNCSQDGGRTSGNCTVLDAIEVLLAAPLLILVGGVMALALRPEDKQPLTLDLSRFRRG